MNIVDKLLTINPYSRSGEKQGRIEYVVVHWVGNANTSATANRNYFNNLKDTHATSASSHYIVGLQGEIVRCIPEDEVSFHAGNYPMNRKSIGIETCHPDWNGKFSDITYNAITDLCADIIKRYNLNINALIRHYDITGKCCPKYYVENPSAWEQFKRDVQNKINGQEVIPEKPANNENVTTYQNGSTPENVYSDNYLSNKIGSLSRYESCDCIGSTGGRNIVRYNVTGTNNYKIGFVLYNGKTSGPQEQIVNYYNGSTPETVFADSNLTKKIGSLDRYETCQCLGKFNGKYIVRYKVNGTEKWKVGFVAYSGGIE